MVLEGRIETTNKHKTLVTKVFLIPVGFVMAANEHAAYSTNEMVFEFTFSDFPSNSTISFSGPKNVQKVTWG